MKLNLKVKLILKLILIFAIVIFFGYIISYYYGSQLVLSLYDINNKNIIFDETYDRFEYNVENRTNKPMNRIIVYSDNENDSNIKSIVLTYAKNSGRLINVTSLDLNSEGTSINKYNIFSFGDGLTDVYNDSDNENITTISFFQFKNANPSEIEHEYSSDDYFLNGKNHWNISIAICNNDGLNYLKQQILDNASNVVISKTFNENNFLFIYENVEFVDVN